MSATALTVRCGSCSNVINVPISLLERLLDVRRFNCPHCREGQQLNPEILTAMARKAHVYDALGGIGGGSRLDNVYDIVHGSFKNGSASNAFRHRTELDKRRRDRDEDEDDDDERGDDEGEEHEPGEVFADYRPAKLQAGEPHPDPVVETASLAAVEPPDVTHDLAIQDLVDARMLSGLQLESVVYACQRHALFLPGGSRCGFFIGDGAGVGKGRTIAGLIVENWRLGRRRHLWISVGADLRVDARRDMNDIGADEIEIHSLNKLPYGRLDSDRIGVGEGIIFLSYSSLVSGSDSGQTRLEQLLEWCGSDYDGLVVFDECHKAKNLVPEAGAKPTKVGRLVLELQQALPGARVVYCSATGASEPRHMGYMERLGLWGEGSPFAHFTDFLDVIGSRGVGALEMVAMDMKARGMYVCRTLSFAGAEFEIIESALEEPVASQYKMAARMWNQLRREFLYALEQAGQNEDDSNKKGTRVWRLFWASHQRFFRHMCMAAKVPNLVRMTQSSLADGKCVVIGLQSTGEARTQDVIAEKGEELDDFVSGPRELLLKLVEDSYPMPLNPDSAEAPKDGKSQGGSKPPTGPKGPKKKRGSAAAPPPAANGRSRKRSKASSDVEIENGEANGLAADSGPEADQHWERKQSSSGAGTSFAAMNSGTKEGLLRVKEFRKGYEAALRRKAQVKACMAGLDLPHNPLDMLIDQLGGPDRVAEMTGRKGRLVRMKREEGVEDDGTKMGVRWEPRNASGVGPGATLEMINVLERSLFLGGTKLIAIISEAASAGISLHADKRAENQRRRVHLTLELPWSADKAIQQFGRSHRANQAHSPQYRLLFTPLGGERRFASAVARRLESLGALTQGDRKAGPSLSAFNYESIWGQRALRHFYRVIMGDEHSPCDVPACHRAADGTMPFSENVFMGKARAQLLGVGIIRPLEDAIHVNMYMSQENGAPIGVGKIADTDKADVARFLNRLLGLEPEWQTYLFDFYQAMLEFTVAEAKRDGKFEDGIVDVRATSVRVKGTPKVIRTDPTTKAATMLFTVVTDRGVSWEQACEMLRNHMAGAVVDLESSQSEGASGSTTAAAASFYRTTNLLPGTGRRGIVLALAQGEQRARTFTIVRPNTGRQPKPWTKEQFTSKYQAVSTAAARQMWVSAHTESHRQTGAGNRLRELHLLSGLVLPIWDEVEACLTNQLKASQRRLNVMRLETTAPEKRRLVGVLLPAPAVSQLLSSHGVSADDDVVQLDD